MYIGVCGKYISSSQTENGCLLRSIAIAKSRIYCQSEGYVSFMYGRITSMYVPEITKRVYVLCRMWRSQGERERRRLIRFADESTLLTLFIHRYYKLYHVRSVGTFQVTRRVYRQTEIHQVIQLIAQCNLPFHLDVDVTHNSFVTS